VSLPSAPSVDIANVKPPVSPTYWAGAPEIVQGRQKALGLSGSAVVAQSFEGYSVALGRFDRGYSMCYR